MSSLSINGNKPYYIRSGVVFKCVFLSMAISPTSHDLCHALSLHITATWRLRKMTSSSIRHHCHPFKEKSRDAVKCSPPVNSSWIGSWKIFQVDSFTFVVASCLAFIIEKSCPLSIFCQRLEIAVVYANTLNYYINFWTALKHLFVNWSIGHVCLWIIAVFLIQNELLVVLCSWWWRPPCSQLGIQCLFLWLTHLIRNKPKQNLWSWILLDFPVN